MSAGGVAVRRVGALRLHRDVRSTAPIYLPGLPCHFYWQVEEGGSSAKPWTPLPPKPRRKANSRPEAGRRPVRLLRRTPRNEHPETNTRRAPSLLANDTPVLGRLSEEDTRGTGRDAACSANRPQPRSRHCRPDSCAVSRRRRAVAIAPAPHGYPGERQFDSPRARSRENETLPRAVARRWHDAGDGFEA